MVTVRNMFLPLCLITIILVLAYKMYEFQKLSLKKGNAYPEERINFAFIFCKATVNRNMKFKLEAFITSLYKHTRLPFTFHVICDKDSCDLAGKIVEDLSDIYQQKSKVRTYDIKNVVLELQDIVSALRPHFSPQFGAYYSDELFFLSVGVHQILKDISVAIMSDIDTKFMVDASLLLNELSTFKPDEVIGLVNEQSPVYRHVLHTYRTKTKNTDIGSSTNPGVNSGVLLLHLDRMRESVPYHNAYLNTTLEQLTSKYSFRGHLGDQDWFTLLSFTHPELIHKLACGWNRQLCLWWKGHGYEQVFDDYNKCETDIFVYHGNCNTKFPDESDS